MRAEHREQLEHPHINEILPAVEGRLQARLHACELGAIFIEETAEAGGVSGSDRGDLLLHSRDVGRGIDPPAAAEDDAVLRIEPHHFHLRAERRAGGGEDFLQHARVEEKGRAEVELEPIGLDGRRAPADGRQPLDDFHFHARSGEQDGGSEAAGACADDDDFFLHGVCSRVKVRVRISSSRRRRGGRTSRARLQTRRTPRTLRGRCRRCANATM